MKKPKPSRPGRPKSPAKADAIMQAATDQFVRHGFDGTSMDAVAAEAGVSKQTVYSHFGSKDELFVAVVSAKVQEYGLDAVDMPAGGGLGRGLETIGRRLLDLLLDERVLAATRMIIGESSRHPRIAKLFFDTGPARTRENIVRYLDAQAARGEFAAPDTEQAAMVFINLLRGPYHFPCLVNARPVPPPAERIAHAAAAVEQFLRIFPPPGAGD
jgi:TetR/AcrR family transcriptional repressor of mexJK operon